MNALDQMFQRLKSSQSKAFMPFVTAGDPDIETSASIVREVARCGADVVEIGFPYSDPIADGSVIQASYTRALAKGLQLDNVFGMIRGLGGLSAPLVGMVSYSLVYHRGVERFVTECATAGLAGAIVPDLPTEEAAELAALARACDFKLIHLVTPTTPPQRAIEIVRQSTGFVYVVSVAGTTGVRQQLPRQLMDQLRFLRAQTTLPLCVGFGISKPDQVRVLREAVDGVIVGSALVRILGEVGQKSMDEVVKEIGVLTTALAGALHAD